MPKQRKSNKQEELKQQTQPKKTIQKKKKQEKNVVGKEEKKNKLVALKGNEPLPIKMEVEDKGNQDNNNAVTNQKKGKKQRRHQKAQQARSGGEKIDFNAVVSDGNVKQDNNEEHIVLDKKKNKQLLQDVADEKLTDEEKRKKLKQSKIESVKAKQEEKKREELTKKKNYLKNIGDKKSALGEVKKKYYEKLITEKKESHPEDPRPKLYFVRIDDIPFGWVKKDIFKFAKQFGGLKKILMPSSIATKRDYGHAFLGFSALDIAKIFVDTMDGYILFNKKISCRLLKNMKSFERAQKKRSLAQLRATANPNYDTQSSNKFMVMKRFAKEAEWKKQLNNVHPKYVSRFRSWTDKKTSKTLEHHLRTFKF